MGIERIFKPSINRDWVIIFPRRNKSDFSGYSDGLSSWRSELARDATLATRPIMSRVINVRTIDSLFIFVLEILVI